MFSESVNRFRNRNPYELRTMIYDADAEIMKTLHVHENACMYSGVVGTCTPCHKNTPILEPRVYSPYVKLRYGRLFVTE
jgi:hypothetical protein